jgi:HAMP domain-containing protein
MVPLVAGAALSQGSRVPPEVLDGQQRATSIAARTISRNLNEGLDDLTVMATTLSRQGIAPDRAELRRSLTKLRDLYGDYRSLYVTDPRGSVVIVVGERRDPDILPPGITKPGITHGVDDAGREVIAWYAPLAGPGGAHWVLTGELALARLRFALDGAQPASAQLVDKRGRVLDPETGAASYRLVDSPILRRAAARASGGAGYELDGRGGDGGELVAWAPVSRTGLAGSLGLGVISTRPLDQVTPPQIQVGEQMLAFGVLLLTIVLGAFGWLYAMLLRPLRHLGQEAERLAYGDLRHPVEIRRYDEIGLIGHSLERVRLVLLRRVALRDADARRESEVH